MPATANCRFRVIKIGPWPWIEREKAIALLTIFKESALGLSRFGTSESRTFPLENRLEDYLDTWKSKRFLILKSAEPWRILVSVMMYPAGASHIGVFIDSQYFSDDSRVEAFMELAKSMYLWGGIDHGFIAHEKEYENKNVYLVGSNRISGGANPEVSLPGVYWVNFFGPRYAEWFGAERLNTVPAYKKEQLSDGGWMVLTRPSLSPYASEATVDMERRIRKHLGEEAFFDNRDPRRKTKVPPFASRAEF